MAGEDISSKSGYNEAGYKMMRIDMSQKRISFVNHNLLAWYGDIGDYGFKIKKTELENLKSEVWGKLGDKPKENCLKYIGMLDSLLIDNPVFTNKRLVTVDGPKKSSTVNEANWNLFKTVLDRFQEYINELLEEAGYSTFTVDTFDGDPYN